MNLTKYKHSKYKLKPNKKKLPINDFTFDRVDEFNKIYQYAKDNFQLVKPTQSQGISVKSSERFEERYFVVKGNERFEMVIICADGCYRFLLHNQKQKGNDINGRKACREIYTKAVEYGIDFNKYMVSDGLKYKSEIVKPHIQVMDKFYIGKVIENVHHIDLNSSYASRISEAYPELKPMYDELYSKRKENNDYYKHVLTNSIGAWQSEHCVNPNDKRTSIPYALSNLSKIAVNGTRHKIEDLINKLENTGRLPLLTNTDGIWYYGSMYHDSEEGTELCQWKNDHKKCRFLMMSSGAYQYEEDGVCHTVVRGICNLDAIEPDRKKWEFGAIKRLNYIVTYKFVEGIGVVRNEEKF